MRIISGKYKSLNLQIPKNLPVRPTTDFGREGLFNVLENELDWEEEQLLDLFSGTGFIAIECFSRGIPKVISVEIHPLCVKHLLTVSTKLNEDWKIVRKDVFQFIKNCTESFSLIIADPPFDLKELSSIPKLVFDNPLILKKDGLLVIEHPKQISFTNSTNFVKEKKYGNVRFSFFKHQ